MKRSAKVDGIRISRYVSRFLNDYAPMNLTSSEATMNGYRIALGSYIGWLEDEKKVTPSTLCAACFEAKLIEEWMGWLKTTKANSNDTCNVRLGALRSFISFLGKQEPEYRYLPAEATCIRRMKKKGRNVSGLTREAVKALLEAPDTSTQSSRRYLAMMILLYSLAARLDEVLSLRINDIHLDISKPCITLTGKGRKVRTLGLLAKSVGHLEKYILETHGAFPEKDAYLFYTKHKGKYEKISQTAVRKALRKYAEIANRQCREVPLTLHAHQFRHAKAEHMLEDGINIVQISEYLGHADLDTTKVYLEVTDRMKAEAFATMAGENDKEVSRKWKNKDGSLRDFIGITRKGFV